MKYTLSERSDRRAEKSAGSGAKPRPAALLAPENIRDDGEESA
jgi:hypothetical protein